MAIERDLNDARAPANADLTGQRVDHRDDNSQENIQLDQRPRPQGRIALLAVALVALFGIIAYSMTSKPVPPDARPTAQTAPASPTGTTAQVPRAPIGQTTGAAPSRPATPGTNAAPAAPTTNGAPTAPSSN